MQADRHVFVVAARAGRHATWSTLLALAALAAGLWLLEGDAWLAGGRSFVQLAGLMLVLYGAILAWWRLEAAALALQARLARAMRRVR